MDIPISETYQLASFLMGIMSQNKSVQKVLINSYIDLFFSQNDWGEKTLGFTESLCESYRTKGIGEMDLFYLKNIAKDKCLGFLKERIDQDNYLLLYKIDEYELSYSYAYKKRHFIHDTYLFGYDDECFHVMAYSKNHLSLLRVPHQEIIDGLYSIVNDEFHFCSFRIYHDIKVRVNIKEILYQVEKYLSGGVNEQGETTGILVYDCLMDLLIGTKIDKDEIRDINPKLFRMLWEHKKMIVYRNQYLAKKMNKLNTLTITAKNMEKKASMIMMLILKFNMSYDLDIIDRVEIYLKELMDEEREYWLDFAGILSEGKKL